MPVKNKTATNTPVQAEKAVTRPPIVVVMGHIDHGKSTLLDFIRQTNIVAKEAGGITQKVGAYEVEVERADGERAGERSRITFIDTPGHAAFQGIRARGAKTADIAILVVSAEDGVKPQTIQAYQTIVAEDMPFIVAINKIDRPNADIERTKQSLAEHEIYLEGYGGNISFVPISAKTGEGIADLLEMVLLTAELEDLQTTQNHCSGFVLESDRDKKKGNAATLIITSGTMKSGEVAVAGFAYSPIRVFENFVGKPIKQASFSSPVRVIGWNEIPPVGATFSVFATKKDAEAFINEQKDLLTRTSQQKSTDIRRLDNQRPYLPIILRAEDAGRLDAVIHEVTKLSHPDIDVKIVAQGVGEISETDIKSALSSTTPAVVIGFGVQIDTAAKILAENSKTQVEQFDIIYKLTEKLEALIKERAPKKAIDQVTGTLKILKTFSRTRDKQIIGGKVQTGSIKVNSECKIMRRGNHIGNGHIKELQDKKERVSSIDEGKECGLMVESKFEITAGDILESFITVEM